MRLILIRNGQVHTYPYDLRQFRKDMNTSMRNDVPIERLAEFGVYVVEEVPQPNASSINVNVVEGTPVFADGIWTQVWKEVPAPAEEVASRALAIEDENLRLEAKADAFTQRFITMTPQEVVAHIDASVTNIASAKTLLKRLSVMMLLMLRREYRE